MQLTDGQLKHLIEIDVWNIIEDRLTPRSKQFRYKMRDMGLIYLQEHKLLGEEIASIWKLTELGEKILQENIVRALMLLQAPSFVVGTVYHHIATLSVEELPELLVHSNRTIREFARARRRELNKNET